MVIASIILCVAALGGATMLGLRLATKRNPPMAIVFLHGLAVLAAFVALGYDAATSGSPRPPLLAGLLLVYAATAGLLMAYKDRRGELLNVDEVIVHAGMALSGVAWLVVLTCRFR